MKKALLVLLVLMIAASGVLMGCQKEKEEEGTSTAGVIKTPASQKIKVIFSGPPELEDK